MRSRVLRTFTRSLSTALVCASLVTPTVVFAQTPEQAGVPVQAAPKIPNEQLDALVAPIALYPDPLLSQTLVASTYPLEVIQLHQWLEKNKDTQKDQKKLAEKVAKQPWDASIQAMAPLPSVVKWLAEDIQWTTDLGNAFLAQQKDVMDAVQRMRAKAKEKGTLASNEQQKVQVETIESKQVIVIEQANPQIVYVPSYDPIYAYGAIGYPYPPIYYPPYYGSGAVAAGIIGFGVGVAIGAAWGGGWGWGAGWGGNDININNNNNFNRNTNINGGNRNNIGNGNRVNPLGGGNNGKWQHNAAHRGGAPYGDRGTADRFGGAARGDSLGNRQQGAQRQLGQNGGLRSNSPGVSDRMGSGNLGSGNRGAGISDRSSGLGSGNRSGGSGLGSGNRGGGSGSFGNGSFGNRGSGGGSLGSGNRGSSSGGFGSGGWGGSSSRSSSSRGMSSMGGSRSMGGGGMSRGGGGMSRSGGGMSRGGGGRRR